MLAWTSTKNNVLTLGWQSILQVQTSKHTRSRQSVTCHEFAQDFFFSYCFQQWKKWTPSSVPSAANVVSGKFVRTALIWCATFHCSWPTSELANKSRETSALLADGPVGLHLQRQTHMVTAPFWFRWYIFTVGERRGEVRQKGLWEIFQLDTCTGVRTVHPLDACRDNEAPGDQCKDTVSCGRLRPKLDQRVKEEPEMRWHQLSTGAATREETWKMSVLRSSTCGHKRVMNWRAERKKKKILRRRL